MLLGYLLDRNRIQLYVDFDRPLTEKELERMRTFIRRRAQGEPLAYILGEKEFMSLPFRVDKRVLIPRPETEHLVERALELFKGVEKPLLVDVGTGSGAIAVSLAHYLPDCSVFALECRPEILELARENAETNGVRERIRFILGDLLEPLEETKEKADGVLANPPYIPRRELSGLSAEVRAQPELALDGGPDGLEFYEPIAKQAREVLKEKGYLGLEVGAGQAEEVKEILDKEGYTGIFAEEDYSGHKRCIWARIE